MQRQAQSAAVERLQVPDRVRTTLTTLVDECERGAGDSLIALIVYGGIARGRFVEGRSDVNVLVLLRRADTASLTAIARPLHDAWRAVRVEPFIIAADELPRVAAVFPVKLLDIQRHHVLIAGSDELLTSLAIPMTFARLRVEQELRNLELRLRRRFIAIATNPDEQVALLASIARPFAVSLAALLELDGRPALANDRTQAIFDNAADAYGLDRATLAALAGIRSGVAFTGDATALFASMLDVIDRARTRAGGTA